MSEVERSSLKDLHEEFWQASIGLWGELLKRYESLTEKELKFVVGIGNYAEELSNQAMEIGKEADEHIAKLEDNG